MPSALEAREAKGPALGAAYFATFGALGIYGPFLALYLQYRGLAPAEIAGLLALLPLLRIVAAPAWTVLADVLRSAGIVLRIVAVGAALSFALLELEPSRAATVAALVAFTLFRAPSSSLIDVLALSWASRGGGQFGPLRAWGTAGYTLAVFGAGLFVTRSGPLAIVHASVAFLALTALTTFALPRGAAPARVPIGRALALLVRRPRFVGFLATAALHQVGLAAYDALFPAYLTGLSNATYAGAAVAVGACAEVVFMANSTRILRGLGLSRVLVLAYGVSAVRWLVVASVTHPLLLVGVQVLHALSFGAFYLAAVALVHEESPDQVRASAQGIFGAATWGIATSASLGLAAFVQARSGLRAVFVVGAFASALAAVLALVLERRGPPRP